MHVCVCMYMYTCSNSQVYVYNENLRYNYDLTRIVGVYQTSSQGYEVGNWSPLSSYMYKCMYIQCSPMRMWMMSFWIVVSTHGHTHVMIFFEGVFCLKFYDPMYCSSW